MGDAILNIFIYGGIFGVGGFLACAIIAFVFFTPKKKKTIQAFRLFIKNENVEFKEYQLILDYKTEIKILFSIYIFLLLCIGLSRI